MQVITVTAPPISLNAVKYTVGTGHIWSVLRFLCALTQPPPKNSPSPLIFPLFPALLGGYGMVYLRLDIELPEDNFSYVIFCRKSWFDSELNLPEKSVFAKN